MEGPHQCRAPPSAAPAPHRLARVACHHRRSPAATPAVCGDDAPGPSPRWAPHRGVAVPSWRLHRRGGPQWGERRGAGGRGLRGSTATTTLGVAPRHRCRGGAVWRSSCSISTSGARNGHHRRATVDVLAAVSATNEGRKKQWGHSHPQPLATAGRQAGSSDSAPDPVQPTRPAKGRAPPEGHGALTVLGTRCGYRCEVWLSPQEPLRGADRVTRRGLGKVPTGGGYPGEPVADAPHPGQGESRSATGIGRCGRDRRGRDAFVRRDRRVRDAFVTRPPPPHRVEITQSLCHVT